MNIYLMLYFGFCTIIFLFTIILLRKLSRVLYLSDVFKMFICSYVPVLNVYFLLTLLGMRSTYKLFGGK